MQFEIIKHRIGEWALSAIFYEDMTGIDEGDEALLLSWLEWAEDDWTDADGNTWVFSHWGSVGDRDEFARDDITTLHGATVEIDAVFKLKPRS